MIDLTPLDVRRKRSDFKRTLGGYDPGAVDAFLERVAARLEGLIEEHAALDERTTLLAERVEAYERRTYAIHEALISAQEDRERIIHEAEHDAQVIRGRAMRESDVLTQQARAEVQDIRERAEAEAAKIIERALGDTERLRQRTEAELELLSADLKQLVEESVAVIDEMEARKDAFHEAYRSLLQRELDALGSGRFASMSSALERALEQSRQRLEAPFDETASAEPSDDVDHGGEGHPLQGVKSPAPSLDGEEPGSSLVGDEAEDPSAQSSLSEVVVVPIDLLARMEDGEIDEQAAAEPDRLPGLTHHEIGAGDHGGGTAEDRDGSPPADG